MIPSPCHHASCIKSILTLILFYFQAGLTPCLQESINSQGYTGSTLPGRFSPDCDRDGNYKPSQCHVSSGVCWCVDSQGQEIPGTRGRGSKQCAAPGWINMTLMNILGDHTYFKNSLIIIITKAHFSLSKME